MTIKIEDQFIGNKLRERRVLLGVSQSKLGKFEGLTFQQVQKYEAGKNKISASRLWRFSKILHVNVYYFFDGLNEAIEADMLDGGADVSNTTRLRKIDAQQEKLDMELRKLSINFLKIKDFRLRKSVAELTKSLTGSLKN